MLLEECEFMVRLHPSLSGSWFPVHCVFCEVIYSFILMSDVLSRRIEDVVSFTSISKRK